MKIIVEVRDGLIWNKDIVALKIAKCMSNKGELHIDLNIEGPDCNHLGLYDLLNNAAELFDYDIGNITLYTCNALEKHDKINIVFKPSLFLLKGELAKGYNFLETTKNLQLKHFGRFIGKSNAPRLMLSAYLDKHYNNKSLITYQYKVGNEYHRDFIGLESLINDFNKIDIESECEFLKSCPRQIIDAEYAYIKNDDKKFSDYLHDQEKGKFIEEYKNFFVEIVSESYFSGNTFFLTEKIFRPILLKTPFIVQGPQWFLSNLKKLGFKTFDNWWDEGYSEDPATHQVYEIQNVIDQIALYSNEDLYKMYCEMLPTLEHNQRVLLSLTDKDFENVRNNNDCSSH